MKNKKKEEHPKTREKYLKLNCILIGIMFIASGAFFAVFSFFTSKGNGYDQLIAIYILCALAVGVGIFQIIAPKTIVKNEADEKNSETRQYNKIMKRRERILKRMRENAGKEHKSLKQELFGQQTVYAVVIGLFFFSLIGLYFFISFGGNSVLIVVCIFVIIALLIYFGYGFGYNSLKKYAERNGIDFSAVEADFRHSYVYSCLNSFISIGCIYTIFMTEGHRYIIENKRIIFAAPLYEKVDNFNNGLYSGTTAVYSVIIKTNTGNTYKIRCAEFAEALIIETFTRNKYFMSENFTAECPDNTPVYIQK